MENLFTKMETRKQKLDKQIVGDYIYLYAGGTREERKFVLEELFMQKINNYDYVEYCIKKNEWTLDDILKGHFANLYCCIEQLVCCSKEILD
ncbi:hypothetical protein [Clostridium grantii]|uniref:Uncharacterized protein n=1 Tax=Clostridium grantii DSM 8605 TaxID=1121316 RepID=A0A1M5SEJ5_9CLOT|nr:hypothetical protein [Clostridium grantii]SHH36698.1 hypothetical protein SAMN02745207_00886 [Clostridium grantii DSM 8605]